MKNILLIEDDLIFSKLLKNFLEKNGYRVEAAHKAAEAYKLMQATKFDLAIIDFRLPDDTGLNVLEWIKNHCLETLAILMTRYSDVRTAISSIKLGALDYIVKPIIPEELLLTIEQTFKSPAVKPAKTVSQAPKEPSGSNYVIGKSKVAEGLYEQIKLVAPTNMSIIVQGESGTGKEYAAQLIHSMSMRKSAPFIAVDCGTLSKELASSELFGHVKGSFTGALNDKEGQFTAADGGTLFLDEIGNLSYEVQVQLLRAIQERKVRKVGSNKDASVDVRIIVATNDDLKSKVEKGLFREDLYHRINEFKVKIPALREREQDINYFAHHFLDQANSELNKNVEDFSPEVLTVFNHYNWPGNLREFKNIIKRGVLLTTGTEMSLTAIPEEILHPQNETKTVSNTLDLKETQKESEKERIVKALEQCRYNKSKAAQLLNIDRKTLYLKLEKYNIEL